MKVSVRRMHPLIVVASLFSPSLNAQDGPGRIAGFVEAIEDGSALAGTSVEVVGTSLRALSDDAGRYRLRGIPLGTVSLRFVRLGYSTLTKTVTVVDDRVLRVTAEMGAGPIRLDPIRVLMERTRMIGDPLGIDEIPGAAHVLVAADLADPVLGSVTVTGYRYRFIVEGDMSQYVVEAIPIMNPDTKRHFYTDVSGIIREERGRPATERSPEL